MPASLEKKLVLVTGGTGFIGGHCIVQLLNAGYAVRTTLRSITRKTAILKSIHFARCPHGSEVSFVETTLTSERNWDQALKDCDYVLHVASPISLQVPKHEDEMIIPAVQGTLHVLKAARDAGVKRVVQTSSFAAVGYSSSPAVFTEEDWTNPEQNNLPAYIKSKTLAEKAAWDFIKREGGSLELTTVNPVAVFGPSLNADLSGAFQIVKGLLTGKIFACPNINFGLVDVRDVADLHLRAMTSPAANGERFLAAAGGIMTLPEIAHLLRAHLGEKARRVPKWTMPDGLLHFAALFSPFAKTVAAQLGKTKCASNEKAKRILGWSPRTNEEAALATAESLFQFGHVYK